MMCKHRGGFPEGQSPIVLDTLSNAEYNIKYLFFKNKKQFTIYYRSTLMKIHLCTNVIKKVFLLIIPNTKSRYSNTTRQTTRLQCTQIIFKIFLKIQQQKRGFSVMMVIYFKVSCL